MEAFRLFTHFDCACGNMSHAVRFYADHDPDYREFGIEIMLNHYLPWHKRLIAGVKYIFGWTSKFSHYDAWILSRFDRSRLISLLHQQDEIDERIEFAYISKQEYIKVLEDVQIYLQKSPHISTEQILSRVTEILNRTIDPPRRMTEQELLAGLQPLLREQNIAEAVKTGVPCSPTESDIGGMNCSICNKGPCSGGPRIAGGTAQSTRKYPINTME